MRILGIDPGTATLGWGVVDYSNKNLFLVDYGVITTKSTLIMPSRLTIIFESLNEIIAKYKPDQCIVEELFFNNNAKTAITVGQARGVVLLAANMNNLDIFEYTPLEVKNALTGYGRAYKGQIQSLVKLILKMKDIPKPDDAADALAIAIIHTQYNKNF